MKFSPYATGGPLGVHGVDAQRAPSMGDSADMTEVVTAATKEAREQKAGLAEETFIMNPRPVQFRKILSIEPFLFISGFNIRKFALW